MMTQTFGLFDTGLIESQQSDVSGDEEQQRGIVHGGGQLVCPGSLVSVAAAC